MILDDCLSMQVGDGVDARYEFEFVELQPIWDEALPLPRVR